MELQRPRLEAVRGRTSRKMRKASHVCNRCNASNSAFSTSQQLPTSKSISLSGHIVTEDTPARHRKMYTEERCHTIGTRMTHSWFAATSLHSRTNAGLLLIRNSRLWAGHNRIVENAVGVPWERGWHLRRWP